ncbi:MAG: response regulator [Endomicrobiia bacterium]
MDQEMVKEESSTKQILLVDDDDSVVEFLKMYISNEGFKVEVAYDGMEALEKVKTKKIDLIILDAMLPRKSGYELVKNLQLSFELKKIPIIIITGHARDSEFRRMFLFESNVKEFLLKPVQPDILVMHIHKLLNTKPKDEKIAEERSAEFKKKFEQ